MDFTIDYNPANCIYTRVHQGWWTDHIIDLLLAAGEEGRLSPATLVVDD